MRRSAGSVSSETGSDSLEVDEKADRFGFAPEVEGPLSLVGSGASPGAASGGAVEEADTFGFARAGASGNAVCSVTAGLQPIRRRSFRTAISLTPSRRATSRFERPSALRRPTSLVRDVFRRGLPGG